jgi:hypothetical protein
MKWTLHARFEAILPRLLHETSLQSVTICQLLSFIALLSSVKRSIHLHQLAWHTFTVPPSITLFLANAVTIPVETGH